MAAFDKHHMQCCLLWPCHDMRPVVRVRTGIYSGRSDMVLLRESRRAQDKERPLG
jgi:hypothetical protein